MTYTRYLTAIVTALRESVLPDVQSGRAKDAINNSINIIGAIAAQLEPGASTAVAAIDATQLPVKLKALAPNVQAPTESAGVRLPFPGPSEDYAIRSATLPLISSGAEWLATQPWPGNAALNKSAIALLQWEALLRSEVMSRVQRAELGLEVTSSGAGGTVIAQADIEAYLRKRLKSSSLRVGEFRFLPGGRVRQTALFTVTGTNDIPSRLVVQREPATKLTQLRGAAMQYAVLERAFAAGMKVARPVMLEMSPEALGAAFAITEQLPGKSPIASMDYWSPPPRSDKLAASLARQFALLHSMPIGDLGNIVDRFVDTGKGQTWLSDVAELEKQWQSLAHAPSMAVSASMAWLRAHVGCVDSVETIVHNDALLHNVLVENDEISAILDWEFAHIGHPYEDLGYVRPVVEQMTDWSTFVEAYVSAGGRRPTAEQVDFFTLRSILKLLIQVLYARSAFETGRTNDPNMAEVGAAFLPRLVDRLATQLNGILRREQS